MNNKPVFAHPGEILRRDYMQPVDLSVSDLAKELSVSKKYLADFLNGKASVTEKMAKKLADAFSTTTDFWLNLQKLYDNQPQHQFVEKLPEEPKQKMSIEKAEDAKIKRGVMNILNNICKLNPEKQKPDDPSEIH